jgi:hypothetical protein
MSGGVISCRQILTANAAVVLTLSAGQQVGSTTVVSLLETFGLELSLRGRADRQVLDVS